MTTETLEAILRNQTKRYVAPVEDSELGSELFRNGFGRYHCMNAAQRASYDAAARNALRAEWAAADEAQIAA
jgi:hypothetical protein